MYDRAVEIHIHHHHTFEIGDGNSKLLAQILKHVVELGVKMSQLDDAITALTAQVTAEDTEIDSVIAFIQGVPALIQTAVDAALAKGANPAQLQSLTDLGALITKKTNDLAAAVVAGTPSAGQTPSA